MLLVYQVSQCITAREKANHNSQEEEINYKMNSLNKKT